MEKDYQTKDLKAVKPKKDGSIFKDKDNLWKFYLNGNVCGYLTKKDAEAGLKKLSEQAKS